MNYQRGVFNALQTPIPYLAYPTQNGQSARIPPTSPVSQRPPYGIGFQPHNYPTFRSQPQSWHYQPQGVPPLPVRLGPGGWYTAPPAILWPSQYYQAPPEDNLIPEPPLPPPPPPNMPTHQFWKGRLAPLPGFSTPIDLLASKTRVPVIIRKPPPEAPKPGGKSLSSPSFSSVSPVNISPDMGASNSELAKDEDRIDKSPTSPQPDKYADPEVPQYLKNIQRQPHTFQPLLPVVPFPPREYMESFLHPPLIESLCKSPNLTLLSAPTPSSAPPLNIETYQAHWSALLGWELDKVADDKSKIVFWNLGVKVANLADAEFTLFIPSIRDNYPRLAVGDLVHMKQVLEAKLTGSGLAFEGRVVALRKRDGFIHLYCPTLKSYIQACMPQTHSRVTKGSATAMAPEDVLPLSFNISFMANARPLFTMDVAARTVGDALSKKSAMDGTVARRWLFPEPEDLEGKFSVYRNTSHGSVEEWLDKGLNEEQRLAVSSIALHHSPVPFLIGGPPGTGKTRTIVEAVVQILRAQPEACILLCAPSNPAADTLVMRLRDVLSHHEMFRLNDEKRTFAQVPATITQYCYVEDDKFTLPPWSTLMRYRVVVCACFDSTILVAAQCTNSALAILQDDVGSSLHPHRKKKQPVAPHWTHLLIDEAAQGPEPELLIPISVILPALQGVSGSTTETNISSNLQFVPQLVLCGDPNQLGPIVSSDIARAAELDISLLERLFERRIYADRASTRSKAHNSPVRKKLTFVPFTKLVKNYRSHPAILAPPSAIFYDDSLEPCANNGTISWSGLPNPRLPLVFLGNDSEEESNGDTQRATWYNSGEIEKTVETIISLLAEGSSSSPPLQPKEIGVMTPWREQVWKIRLRLRKQRLGDVDVGTVEDFQGRECRAVIISCVRSDPRFLEEDGIKGAGLVFERKRMNVAITRARELLVVIGNGSLLQRDPYWKSFLQFALRNKLYVGPELQLYMGGNYISRLESEYINTKENGIGLEEEKPEAELTGELSIWN